MESSLIIAGFGGQGIISAGQILAKAFMLEGLEITWLPAYGAEMRGGTVNCTLSFSDDEVASAYIEEPDTVIAMNLPSFERFEKSIKPGGLMIANSSLINTKMTRKDIEYYYIPLSGIANEIGNIKTANMAALGAFVALRPFIKPENVRTVIDETFSLNKKAFVEVNIKAFNAGLEKVRSEELGVRN